MSVWVDPDNLSVSLGILNLTDSFDMGFDIQQYYSLHQNLTLEDLAKASSRHTLKGVVKVINKVSLSPKGAFLYDVRSLGSSLREKIYQNFLVSYFFEYIY